MYNIDVNAIGHDIGLTKMFRSVSDSVSGLKREVGMSTEAISSYMDGLENRFNSLASSGAFTAVTAGIAMSMKQGLQEMSSSAKEYELAMANLKYNAQVSSAEFKRLNDEIINIGTNSLYSATEASTAMYELFSYGLQGSVSIVDQAGNQIKRKMSEIATSATLDFSTMTRGMVSLADSAAFMGAAVAKAKVDLSQGYYDNTGRWISELDRLNDKIAKASIVSGLKPEDMPVVLNSMRTAMNIANVDVETMLSMVGTLRTLGMQPAEAGNKIVEYARKMADIQTKYLNKDMYAAIRARTGKNPMASTLGSRQTYWLDELYGNRQTFEASLRDQKGNFRDAISFLSDMNERLDRLGYDRVKKMAFLKRLSGSTEFMQMYIGFAENASYSLDEPIYAVDKWGQRIKENGEYVVKFAAGTYQGIEALNVMRAAINDSMGSGREYAKMMEETWWGIEKHYEAVKDTTMAVYGTYVNELKIGFYTVLTKVLTAMTSFAKEYPNLARGVTYMAVAATIAMSALAALGAFMTLWSLMYRKQHSIFANLKQYAGDTLASFVGKSPSVAVKSVTEGVAGVAGKATRHALRDPITGRFIKNTAAIEDMAKAAENAAAKTSMWSRTTQFLGKRLSFIGSGIRGGATWISGVYRALGFIGKLFYVFAAFDILKGLSQLVGYSAGLHSLTDFFKDFSGLLKFLKDSLLIGSVDLKTIAGMGKLGAAGGVLVDNPIFRTMRRMTWWFQEYDKNFEEIIDASNKAGANINTKKLAGAGLVGKGVGSMVGFAVGKALPIPGGSILGSVLGQWIGGYIGKWSYLFSSNMGSPETWNKILSIAKDKLARNESNLRNVIKGTIRDVGEILPGVINIAILIVTEVSKIVVTSLMDYMGKPAFITSVFAGAATFMYTSNFKLSAAAAGAAGVTLGTPLGKQLLDSFTAADVLRGILAGAATFMYTKKIGPSMAVASVASSHTLGQALGQVLLDSIKSPTFWVGLITTAAAWLITGNPKIAFAVGTASSALAASLSSSAAVQDFMSNNAAGRWFSSLPAPDKETGEIFTYGGKERKYSQDKQEVLQDLLDAYDKGSSWYQPSATMAFFNYGNGKYADVSRTVTGEFTCTINMDKVPPNTSDKEKAKIKEMILNVIDTANKEMKEAGRLEQSGKSDIKSDIKVNTTYKFAGE